MNYEGLNYATAKMARQHRLSVKKNENFEMLGYATPPTQRKLSHFRRESLASTSSESSTASSEMPWASGSGNWEFDNFPRLNKTVEGMHETMADFVPRMKLEVNDETTPYKHIAPLLICFLSVESEWYIHTVSRVNTNTRPIIISVGKQTT